MTISPSRSGRSSRSASICAVADALDAVGAFLHDAAAAHAHLAGSTIAAGRSLVLGIAEEIEAPHLVRAVVRAEPRADAAVVDHQVEAVMVVHGGVHRADDLARRVLAMHARHRLERDVGRVRRPGVIAVDAQPVHDRGWFEHLFLADDRDVVFRLAGDRRRPGSRCRNSGRSPSPRRAADSRTRDRAISSRPSVANNSGSSMNCVERAFADQVACPATRSWPCAVGERETARRS